VYLREVQALEQTECEDVLMAPCGLKYVKGSHDAPREVLGPAVGQEVVEARVGVERRVAQGALAVIAEEGIG